MKLVVLAAGAGRRFGAESHKSLAAVDPHGGTLARLLRQLATDPHVADVTVVVGAHAESVSDAARAIIPAVRLVVNENFAHSGPASSVAVALRDLAPGPVWVLLADTVYQPEFLQAIWSTPAHGAAVAVHRPRRPLGAPVTEAEVPVVVRDGQVAALGPPAPRDFEMAPAVRWDAEHWPLVLAGADQPTQWRIMAAAMANGDMTPPIAVEVPADSFFDVDTRADLLDARSRLSRC